MTPERRARLGVALAIVLAATFALLAHGALVEGMAPSVGALLSLVPLALLLFLLLRHTRHRAAALAGLGLAAAGLWLGWAHLERHFPSLFFVEHAGANLLLAVLFGRTLLEGREPMVTRFARTMHDHLPPEVERYTRRVTIAWTAFFVTLFALSCALYLGGLLSAWSLLATILSPLLIGAMFVAEYLVRHRVLPHWERVGVVGSFRAFSRHVQARRAEAR